MNPQKKIENPVTANANQPEDEIINVFSQKNEIKFEKKKLGGPVVQREFATEFTIGRDDKNEIDESEDNDKEKSGKRGFRNTMTNIYDDLEKTFTNIEMEGEEVLSKSENVNLVKIEGVDSDQNIEKKDKKRVPKKASENSQNNVKPSHFKNEKLIYDPSTYNPDLKVMAKGLQKFINQNSIKKIEKKPSIYKKEKKSAKNSIQSRPKNLTIPSYSKKHSSYSNTMNPPLKKKFLNFTGKNFFHKKKHSMRVKSSLLTNHSYVQNPFTASIPKNMQRSHTLQMPNKHSKHIQSNWASRKNSRDLSLSPFTKSARHLFPQTTPHSAYNNPLINNPEMRGRMNNQFSGQNSIRNVTHQSMYNNNVKNSRNRYRSQMKNYIDSTYRKKEKIQHTLDSEYSETPREPNYTTRSTNLSPYRRSPFFDSEMAEANSKKGKIQFIDLTNNYSQRMSSFTNTVDQSRDGGRSSAFKRPNESMTWIPDTNSISKEDLESKLLAMFKKILVYCSKINAIKHKILKNNAGFSAYSIFKQFCIRKKEIMTNIEFANFTQYFGFSFSQLIIIKMMSFLKRFKSFTQNGAIGIKTLFTNLQFY